MCDAEEELGVDRPRSSPVSQWSVGVDHCQQAEIHCHISVKVANVPTRLVLLLRSHLDAASSLLASRIHSKQKTKTMTRVQLSSIKNSRGIVGRLLHVRSCGGGRRARLRRPVTGYTSHETVYLNIIYRCGPFNNHDKTCTNSTMSMVVPTEDAEWHCPCKQHDYWCFGGHRFQLWHARVPTARRSPIQIHSSSFSICRTTDTPAPLS
ncbi:hypothetical protein J6590_019625 [Homalodisca vitripennis]|nr:hypothetical protein J6590_019625 [Homalodisca vitripennis]